ncbi:MAG: UbiA family prenyltransferase [Prolixibacteraceae bacterium]
MFFVLMQNYPVIKWFDRNTVKHLRFSFSFFLLPVFLFAVSQAPEVNWVNAAIAFIILHFLIFPSSNGYNSYQDRDETSIGGLKNPPKVSKNLYYVTLLFDIAGILLALFVSIYFSVFILIFVIMSRLYSYRGIRLKQYPVTAFMIVFIFQGAFVYLMTFAAVTSFSFSGFFSAANIVCMAIASLFIGSMYPLTQIYQHEADKKDGVISLSYKLGYHGTFLFSAALFVTASALLLFHLTIQNHRLTLLLFLVFILPLIFQLSKWFGLVKKNIANADFEHTMKTNLLASTCMNCFFLILIINNQILIL